MGYRISYEREKEGVHKGKKPFLSWEEIYGIIKIVLLCHFIFIVTEWEIEVLYGAEL